MSRSRKIFGSLVLSSFLGTCVLIRLGKDLETGVFSANNLKNRLSMDSTEKTEVGGSQQCGEAAGSDLPDGAPGGCGTSDTFSADNKDKLSAVFAAKKPESVEYQQSGKTVENSVPNDVIKVREVLDTFSADNKDKLNAVFTEYAKADESQQNDKIVESAVSNNVTSSSGFFDMLTAENSESELSSDATEKNKNGKDQQNLRTTKNCANDRTDAAGIGSFVDNVQDNDAIAGKNLASVAGNTVVTSETFSTVAAENSENKSGVSATVKDENDEGQQVEEAVENNVSDDIISSGKFFDMLAAENSGCVLSSGAMEKNENGKDQQNVRTAKNCANDGTDAAGVGSFADDVQSDDAIAGKNLASVAGNTVVTSETFGAVAAESSENMLGVSATLKAENDKGQQNEEVVKYGGNVRVSDSAKSIDCSIDNIRSYGETIAKDVTPMSNDKIAKVVSSDAVPVSDRVKSMLKYFAVGVVDAAIANAACIVTDKFLGKKWFLGDKGMRM